MAVAIAVIGHDFADGLNTVSLLLDPPQQPGPGAQAARARRPHAGGGGAAHAAVQRPRPGPALYLGVFAGFLLYVGASDVLPEAHAEHPSWATLALTVSGAAAMYVVVQVLA